ncbi:hypothetical protein ACOMHN_024025 [Nucella lapillus]
MSTGRMGMVLIVMVLLTLMSQAFMTPLHSRLHHRYSRVVNPATTCSLASITTAAGRSTHCPGTLTFITAAAGWSTQRCPWTLALIIDIAAVS